MAEGIEELLRHPALWRPGDAPAPRADALPSGFAALDRALPGGGWPPGAITEIHAAGEGIGELGLVLPALVKTAAAGGWTVWVAPPHLPFAPALAARGADVSRLLVVRDTGPRENLWAAEQALSAPACGAVLLWEGRGRFSVRDLRRLQLAAKAGGGFGVVFRRPGAGATPSPAALRLKLEPEAGDLAVTLLKCRGGVAGKRILVTRDARLNGAERM